MGVRRPPRGGKDPSGDVNEGRPPGVRVRRPRRGVRSGEAPGVGGRRVSGWCLLAPSRGGVPQLGETRSAELTLGDPCLLYGPFPANAHPPLGVRAL